jgi:hypothetical protein
MEWQMITLIIGLYFSLTLLTASLAKLADVHSFTASLRVSPFIPKRVIPLAQKGIPLGEFVLAFLIILQENSLVAAANLLLFILFLGYRLDAVSRNRASYCGCFGRIYREKIDSVSLTVSAIQVGLAVFFLWLVIQTEPADAVFRLITAIGLLVLSCLILWRIQQRRKFKLRTI